MPPTTDDPASPWRRPMPPADPVVATTSAVEHELPIVFHGSGSEYFRIWVVNLLLTLATVGLYHPWAKARRLRYFYANTFIGEHALDFHGDPKLMLRGFLIAAALAIGYSVAGKVSVTAGWIAFGALAVVWPALFWTSQRFRLANTSWRGLRFRFSGNLGGAYRSLLPVFLPGALFLALSTGGSSRPAPVQLLLVPLAVLLLPLVLWSLKRYQHGHFNLGQVRTELRTGVGSFYLVALRTLGVMLLPPFLLGLIAAILLPALQGYIVRSGGLPDRRQLWVILGALVLVYGALILLAQPYFVSRLQNLVWGRTQSRELRFASRLRYGPLLWLTWKNTLLVIVTLGLYAPFARIASARMRLQALSLRSTLDPDQLAASLHERGRPGATGDAAGELLGFDIGW